MLVPQHFELMQHGCIVHLVARGLWVIGPEDETMAAIQVTDVGHINQGEGILPIAEIRWFGDFNLLHHATSSPLRSFGSFL